MVQDIRHALRALAAAPGFTSVAIVVLALGIGATSAVFSLAYGVLLRPIPFPEPDRIVSPISVQMARGIRDGGVSYADYLDWRLQSDVFHYTALWRPANMDLTGGDIPERVRAVAVTGEYFRALGIAAAAGRTFGPEADASGDRLVVLSSGAWERLFGGELDAVGRTLYLSGAPHTILGVLPRGLIWPADTDVFVPLRLDPAQDPSLLRRDNFIFRAVARLQPGTTVAQAQARVATLARSIEDQFPESRSGWTYDVVTLHAYTVGQDFRAALLLLASAVALVLLIACVNVANLLLARGVDRRRELAVRAALGASRARLRRTLLTESGLLALFGGTAGLALSYWLSQALVIIAPPNTPLLSEPRLDWPMIGFTAAAALATTLISGFVPALQGATVSPADALKEGGRSSSSRRWSRARDLLVVAEVALAVVLLVGAALTLRSLVALTQVDPGVDVEQVLGARVILPSARYPEPSRRAAFYEQLLDRISEIPDVRSAAISSRLPAGGPGFGLGRVFLAEGQPEPPASSDVPALWTVVSPEYFATLGARLTRGRAFTRFDRAESTPVIIVSQLFAQQAFPGADPVGRRVRSWRDENQLREIVGVVDDVRYFGLADRPRAVVYVPHAQDSWGTMMLAVRTAGDPLQIVSAVRAEVASLDPMLALGDVGTLKDFSTASVADNRFTARLLGAFATLALLLAAVGVYGVMAFAVSRRAHEIGVRLALGATRSDVARLVVGRGMLLAALGLLAGGGAAAALARTLVAMLPEVGPFDLLAFATASAILLATALAACIVPAIRATRLDPVSTLRQG